MATTTHIPLIGSALLLLLLMAAGALAGPTANIHDESTYFELFKDFKKEYKRHYKDADAEASAFGHFAYNMRAASAASKENPHATFGFNEFSDMSAAEFKAWHNAENYFAARALEREQQQNHSSSSNGTHHHHAHARAAEALGTINIDWRAYGVVSSVKSQGGCGDCWAFSAVGNIEGQWALAGHGLVSLSPQQLCSCDTSNSACGGGLMDNTFNWLVARQGGWITSDAAYPYTSGYTMQRGACYGGKPAVARITGHTDVAGNEAVMAAWVASNGPLSVAVASPAWQSYRGGILTYCGGYALDHGVLIVGVNTINNPPYWIIKNSWGSGWGEGGYIRLAFGSNQCRIATIPSSAIVPRGGPAVVPPPPPPYYPPAPAPAPATGGSFVQYQCASTGCSSGCSAVAYPTGRCLPYGAGQSVIVSCSTTTLVMHVYSGGSCAGGYSTGTQALNQCMTVSATQHFYNTCRLSATANETSTNATDATPAPATKLLVPEHQ